MLKGSQKKYLKGLAHGLKPVIFIGHKGLSPTLAKAVEDALDAHELIKVRFVDFKEKDQKEAFTMEIEKNHRCSKVSMVGHIAVFYRKHKNPKKRKIILEEGAI
jgi:RNA-binding protein